MEPLKMNLGILLSFITVVISISTAVIRMFIKTMFTEWAEKFEDKLATETDRIVNLKLDNVKKDIDFHNRELIRIEAQLQRLDERKQTRLSGD